MDGWTHPLIEAWLTTKNHVSKGYSMCGKQFKIGSFTEPEVVVDLLFGIIHGFANITVIMHLNHCNFNIFVFFGKSKQFAREWDQPQLSRLIH